MNEMINATRQPVVYIRDGEACANSRDVAAYFDKNHKDVLRAVSMLSCSAQFTERNFTPSSYRDVTGRELPMIEMTKDGFVFLAMGFTGEKAARFKEAYISQFNAMEAELRHRPAVDPMQVLNDAAAMRGLLLTYTEKVISLEAKVQAQAPDVAALERIAKSDGLLTPTDAAKTLGVPPQHLFKWLDTHGWTYRRVGSAERVAYQTKIQAGYLDHKTHTFTKPDGSEKTISRVVVTPAGLAALAKNIGPGAPGLH